MTQPILAFDLATTTGWATADPYIESGFWTSTKKQHWWGTLREHHIRLDYYIDRVNPRVIVVEEPQFMRSRDAARVCYSLYHILDKDVCKPRKMRMECVSPSALKKWATGSGKAKKPEMLAAARMKSKVDVLDHNEADAILLALYGKDVLGL